jgi:hypothetical protein
MRGAISPFSKTPSWRGAQLNEEYRDKFTFTFIIVVYICKKFSMYLLTNLIIISYYIGHPAWGLGEGLTTYHSKRTACYGMLHGPSELVGCCEYGNELSVSMKGGEFLVY